MPTLSSQRWESREQQFCSDWERTYPNTPWNDVRLGYRYGWESAHSPRYAGRGWDAAASDLRAGWESWQTRQSESRDLRLQLRWEELKDSVRRGWEQAMREVDKTA